MSDEPTRLIVLRARTGDPHALESIVHRHQLSVRAYLAARLEDVHEAEDLAQEVFVTAFRRLGDFDPTRPMSAWLRGIASNLLRNHLRRRHGEVRGIDSALESTLERNVARLEEERGGSRIVLALRQCVQTLEPHARTMVERRYAHGDTLEALRRGTELKHSALTMTLHRIRRRLRDCMERRMAAAGEGVS